MSMSKYSMLRLSDLELFTVKTSDQERLSKLRWMMNSVVAAPFVIHRRSTRSSWRCASNSMSPALPELVTVCCDCPSTHASKWHMMTDNRRIRKDLTGMRNGNFRLGCSNLPQRTKPTKLFSLYEARYYDWLRISIFANQRIQMHDFSQAIIKKLIVHEVGNKPSGEPFWLSEQHAQQLTENQHEQLLGYFTKQFILVWHITRWKLMWKQPHKSVHRSFDIYLFSVL